MKQFRLKSTFLNINIYLVTLFIFIFTLLYYPYLTHHKIYIFLSPNNDYLIEYWPYRKYLLDIISNHQLFNNLFLFGNGLGNNIFALKAVVFDPFNWLFLNNSSTSLIIWQYLCKLFVIYIITYNILIIRTKNQILANIFSILFAFNGMFVFWSTQDSNFTAMVLMVLQWYGYELYKNSGRKVYFILLSLPLFMLATVYWAILFNLFFVVFIILDLMWDCNINTNQKRLRLFYMFVAYFMIILISAWSILPELWVLAHNARVGSDSNQIHSLLHIKLVTQFGTIEPWQLYNLKFYTQFILRGFGNYTIAFDKIWVSPFSGPLWYCSIFLLASAIAYIISYLHLSRKVLLNFSICIVCLLLFLPLITIIFNGMSDVRMRWSWFLLIPLLICAVKYWNEIPNLARFRLSLIIISIVFSLAAFYAYIVGDLYFADSSVSVTYIEILICFILLFSLSFIKKYAFLALVLVGFADMIFQNYMFVHNAKAIDANYISTKQYYSDNTINAIRDIKQHDKTTFYRVDKLYSSLSLCDYCGLNENMIQGYYGVKTYISTPNPAYFAFSKDMGAKPYYNFIFGFDGRYDVLRMLGVKYLLSKTKLALPGFSYQQKVDDINIYEANNYNGIAHVFHNYISYDEFMQLNTQEKDLAFSRCTIFKDVYTAPANLKHIAPAQCLKQNSILNGTPDNFTLQKFNGRNIVGIANLPNAGVLYLAIPYDDGFSAKVDGKAVPVLNVSDGYVGIDMIPGKHYIELSYIPPLLKIGILISCITTSLILLIFAIMKRPNK